MTAPTTAIRLEVEALQRIVRLLEKLDDNAKGRVLDYVIDVYDGLTKK